MPIVEPKGRCSSHCQCSKRDHKLGTNESKTSPEEAQLRQCRLPRTEAGAIGPTDDEIGSHEHGGVYKGTNAFVGDS